MGLHDGWVEGRLEGHVVGCPVGAQYLTEGFLFRCCDSAQQGLCEQVTPGLLAMSIDAVRRGHSSRGRGPESLLKPRLRVVRVVSEPRLVGIVPLK